MRHFEPSRNSTMMSSWMSSTLPSQGLPTMLRTQRPGRWDLTWQMFRVSIWRMILSSSVSKSTVMRAPVTTPVQPPVTASSTEDTTSPK